MPNEFGHKCIYYFSLQSFEIIKADIEIKVLLGVTYPLLLNFLTQKSICLRISIESITRVIKNPKRRARLAQ